VEEFSQVLFARRNFEWADLACDFLGICLGSLLMRIISPYH
jgi:glycopeptide antibiotics resistance protein